VSTIDDLPAKERIRVARHPGPEVPTRGHNMDISSVLCMPGYEPSTLYIRPAV